MTEKAARFVTFNGGPFDGEVRLVAANVSTCVLPAVRFVEVGRGIEPYEGYKGPQEYTVVGEAALYVGPSSRQALSEDDLEQSSPG